MMKWFKYLFLGIVFGFILVKTEVISWFRIQEMFRFHSFHMYGVIGSAVLVGSFSLWMIRVFGIRSIQGERIEPKPKPFMPKAQLFGGIIFGLGWALTGACPGPLYALAGSGYSVIWIAILGAVLGTFVYGHVKDRLPH